jgi:hypothetical protein
VDVGGQLRRPIDSGQQFPRKPFEGLEAKIKIRISGMSEEIGKWVKASA